MIKKGFLLATLIVAATSAALSREMECSYDYITFTQIRYMTELDDGNIAYSWRHVDSETDTYKYDGSTELQTDERPLRKISRNLYLLAPDDWFPSIYYIDFSTATKREVQRIDEAMKSFADDSIKLTEQSQLVTIPIQIWNCKRTY